MNVSPAQRGKLLYPGARGKEEIHEVGETGSHVPPSSSPRPEASMRRDTLAHLASTAVVAKTEKMVLLAPGRQG